MDTFGSPAVRMNSPLLFESIVAYPGRDIECEVTVTKVCPLVYIFCIIFKMRPRLCIGWKIPLLVRRRQRKELGHNKAIQLAFYYAVVWETRGLQSAVSLNVISRDRETFELVTWSIYRSEKLASRLVNQRQGAC